MASFDILKASVEAWEEYLLDHENHEQTYAGDFTKRAKSPLERMIEAFVHADVTIETRRAVVANAIQATLNQWDSIVPTDDFLPFGVVNPLMCLPRLAYQGKNSVDALVAIVQRLWHDSKRGDDYTRLSVKLLVWGLGKHMPVDNDFLVMLYRTHFEQYSFTALQALLERGEIEHANDLFVEHAARYTDFDPLTLDTLVSRGLSPASAKTWLDQSINAKAGYEGHYNEAIVRWDEIATRR